MNLVEQMKQDRDRQDRVNTVMGKIRPGHTTDVLHRLARQFVDDRAPLPVLRAPLPCEEQRGDYSAHRAFNGMAMRFLQVLVEMRRYSRQLLTDGADIDPEYVAYLDGFDYASAGAEHMHLLTDEGYLDGIACPDGQGPEGDEVAVNQSYDALKLIQD